MFFGGGVRYQLETPDTLEKDFYFPFSKLYDTQTTLIENTKYKIKRGIYIDIFPIDGIGNTREEAMKNYRRINSLYNFLLTRVTGIRKGRSFYKNLAVRVVQLIPESVIKNKKILKRLVCACKQRNFDDCDFVGNLCGAWRYKEIIPKIVFGVPKTYVFEDIEIKGVADADKYLTYLYGDWRKLPPEEKQASHHDFVLCDLENSYLNT